ncbi:hypothetical protein SUGI_1020340 [Cryptomeria japonica]|uniref:uncharacterized protein LOC131059825 n=1 Tax=Cryptomeria japonica TaxID=3369 RepID=UPI0024146A37|nr:uncharacterized protein LOC131059825 [Cryptomeria japonica]GLJ48334.1 hypothetical protein SUGI_1020340 [Cryptomeria japonica]
METLSVERIGPPHRFRSMEFEFRSNSPSSGGFYFSAPTSPVRSTAILSDFAKSIRAVVPFGWEEKPGTPKKNGGKEDGEESSDDDGDFEFCKGFVVSEERRNSVEVLTAEELFSNGQIRPLRLPPRLQKSFDFEKPTGSFKKWGSSKSLTPRSPRSPLKEGQRIVKEALWRITKRGKGGDFDPFAAALKGTVGEEHRRRGLDRSPGRRGGRSCSPLGSFNCSRGDGPEFSSESKSGKRRNLKDFLIRKGRRGWSFFMALAPARHLKKQQPYINIANQIQYRIG